MRRREFITLLGGAAAAWPLGAGAQQADRIKRIAYCVLLPYAERDVDAKARLAAFRNRLQELGWLDGSQREDRFALGRGRCRTPARPGSGIGGDHT